MGMEAFNSVVNGILASLGSSVLVTVVMFILGMCFGAGFKKSLRGSLYAGIGLAGLFVVTNAATAALEPAIKALAQVLGTSQTMVDLGWGNAGLAFSWPGAAFTIIAVIIVNLILILLGAVKTMWTDMWSYWHGQVVGCFVWAMTGNLIFGILAATIFLTANSFVADYSAKRYQEFNGMPGISVPCTVSFLAIFARPFNAFIDVIPGFKSIDASPEAIRDKIGVFGDQGVMGFIIGLIIGLINWIFRVGTFTGALNLAVQVGVLMVFLPKTVSVLCEGVIPITNAVIEFVHEKFSSKREIYVAVDCAALLGHPSVMASTVILYPLIVVLSVILPGTGILPIASLAIVPYWCGAVAPYLKGNVFRIVLFTLIWTIPVMYIATFQADIHTAAMARMGLGDPAVISTAFDMGGDPLGALIVQIFKLFR
jgi:PTS system galactitol-specific IIC component